MKKLLFVVLSFSLAFLFALSGCSCAATQPLSFNKAYLGEKTGNYSEILEYSVGYESSYQDISNNTEIRKDQIPEYKGTYVVEFSNSHNALPSGINTDIDYEQDYHYIKSVLSLDVTFNGKTYNDKIVSEVYFHSKDWSLAPVYSKSTIKNTYLSIEDNEVDQKIYQYSIIYTKSNYTVTKTYYAPDANEDVNLIDVTNTTDSNSSSYFNTQKLLPLSGNENSQQYQIRTIIDNAQLLFAIRSSNIDDTIIPTTSFTYDQPVKMMASYKNDVNYTFEKLTYNGENKDNTNIPVENLEFSINSTNNRGSSKYLSIQKESANGVNDNALIVEYAEPILSGISNIGALVYKLNKVTIVSE